MEAAGTIVGVVSLGIVLCDNVIQYCRAWKHQDNDVQTLKELASDLKGTLAHADTLLQRQSDLDPELVINMNRILQVCNDQISKATNIASKYATGKTTNNKGKLKDLIQKMKFPFEKNVLVELRDVLMAFQHNVNTTLGLLNIDMTATAVELMRKVQTDNTNEFQHITDEVRNATVQINQSIERGIFESSNDLMSQLQERNAELDTFSHGQQTRLDKIDLGQAQILYLLHQIQEDVSTHTGSFSMSHDPVSEERPGRKKWGVVQTAVNDWLQCTCVVKTHVQYANSILCFGKLRDALAFKVAKEIETSIIHARNCPLWYQSKTHAKYRMYSQFLGWSMSGSLEFKRAVYIGLRGWQIAPTLTFRPMVPRDSPAFKVLDRYVPLWCSKKVISIVDCLRDLDVVYRSGQGSPGDVSTDGNLLQIACKRLAGPWPKKLWQLAQGLHSMGVDINESNGKESFIDILKTVSFFPLFPSLKDETQQGHELILWSIQKGANMNLIPFSGASWSIWPARRRRTFILDRTVGALRSSEDFAIAAGCGPLSIAVLRRDQPRIQAILLQHAYLIETERDAFGHSPIYLAVGWPKGLRCLLGAATDSVSLDSCAPYLQVTPLDYAISIGCVESMKLLESRNVSFNSRWICYVASPLIDPAASHLIPRFVTEQYRRFQDFAVAVLRRKLKGFRFRSFAEFHSKTIPILAYLDKEDIAIPRIFQGLRFNRRLCFGTIFHQYVLPVRAAQGLFDQGFSCIDTPCRQLTPLMCLKPPSFLDHPGLEDSKRFFSFVEFLVEKGARLDKEIPSRYILTGANFFRSTTPNRHRVVHRIALVSSDAMLDNEYLYPDFTRVAKLWSSETWRAIFTSTVSDPCLCSCSSGGCRAITMALKSSVTDYWLKNSPTRSRLWNIRSWKYTLKLLDMVAILLSQLDAHVLANDVLRLLTFSALKLTHTCCAHNFYFFPRYPPDELKDEILNDIEISPDDEIAHQSDNLDRDLCEPRDQKMIVLKDPNDIQEIRKEETSMIKRLDQLIVEFMQEMEELKISLPEFITTRWQERMYAELSAKDEVSESDRKAMLELGVNIVEEVEEEIQKPMAGPFRDPHAEYDAWIRSLRESIK